jgi:hypothetical protein
MIRVSNEQLTALIRLFRDNRPLGSVTTSPSALDVMLDLQHARSVLRSHLADGAMMGACCIDALSELLPEDGKVRDDG